MDATVGLRERKKAATRQALHDAALRLAAESGYDRVTVEQIADAANVSRRTFSNYFGSKEEAFVHGDVTRLRRLLELVRARPADEPPWTALGQAAAQQISEFDSLTPQRLAQWRLLRSHPGLIAHQLAAYAAAERELATEIAARIPADPEATLRSRVLAATFLTTVRVATQQWIDSADEPSADLVPLADLVRQALSYVANS